MTSISEHPAWSELLEAAESLEATIVAWERDNRFWDNNTRTRTPIRGDPGQ